MALSIIHKYRYLFTRRRKRICLIFTFLMSVFFVIYQFLIHYVVSNDPTENPALIDEKLIRGTHAAERSFYAPMSGKFRCFKSGEIIDFEKVNDDYCDCADSTDEPGTNACPDGVFHCSNISYNKKYPKMIPSSKVNDGICDCCDGSEEYGENRVINNFKRTLQTKMKHFLVPCPNVC